MHKQYVIKRTDISTQEHLEVFNTSREEAQAYLELMESKARTAQEAARRANPRGEPAVQDRYAYYALDTFLSRKYVVEEREATRMVYRLNTVPSESPNLVREIMTKMDWFGRVELVWTCTGHTRAQMQGSQAAIYLEKLGLTAEVDANGDVTITREAKKEEQGND